MTILYRAGYTAIAYTAALDNQVTLFDTAVEAGGIDVKKDLEKFRVTGQDIMRGHYFLLHEMVKRGNEEMLKCLIIKYDLSTSAFEDFLIDAKREISADRIRNLQPGNMLISDAASEHMIKSNPYQDMGLQAYAEQVLSTVKRAGDAERVASAERICHFLTTQIA